MKTIALILAGLIGSAHAQGVGYAQQSQTQEQSQFQTQGQSQSATGVGIAGAAATVRVQSGPATATSAPSSAALTINEAAGPSRIRIENTPDITIANVAPTAPCMGGTSVGGSGPGFSLAVGSSWEAEECQIGETARGFEQAGYREDALYIRCQGKYAAVAPSCKALRQ
jgi:hypothetical protein